MVEIQRETCGHTNPEELKLPNSQFTPSRNRNVEYSVYPNPTTGSIGVSWKNFENSQVANIEIYEITGRKLISEEVRAKNQTKYYLPNAGIYLFNSDKRCRRRILERGKAIAYLP